MNVLDQVEIYNKHGFMPFPLSPNSKQPPEKSHLDTIETLPFTRDSNIGLFPNYPDGFVIVDADEEVSKVRVTEKLDEMGLLDQTAIVRTPRKDGSHFWLKVGGMPNSYQSAYNLSNEIGRGELRCKRNAYVVAPGSVLPEGEYYFSQGGIETFLSQPVINWSDLDWLRQASKLDSRENLTGNDLIQLPIRLLYRENPSCLQYFRYLASSEKGREICIPELGDLKTGEPKTFRSRSEAEFAVMIGLIRNGWLKDEIFDRFEREQPGHYAESANPADYLEQTYNNALQELLKNEHSTEIIEAYIATQNRSFPGRCGEYQQKILEAILAQAWQFKTLIPNISLREISEYTAINSLETIRNNLRRLKDDKRIFVLRVRKQHSKSTAIDISPWIERVKIECVTNKYISNSPPVTNVPVNDKDTKEIWSRKFLGGSAKLVYIHLSESEPKTVKKLADETGKSRNTVSNALKYKLLPNGLAEEEENGWIRGIVSPEILADKWEVEEERKSREKKHVRQREVYKEHQELRKKKQHQQENNG